MDRQIEEKLVSIQESQVLINRRESFQIDKRETNIDKQKKKQVQIEIRETSVDRYKGNKCRQKRK